MEYSYLDTTVAQVHEEINRACTDAGRDPSEITCIVVTKRKPCALAQAVISRGNVHIGENRPQEIMEKVPQLQGNFTMHLIGQLQSNKVNKVAPYIDWAHSVDRPKIITKLNDAAGELSKTINICLQVNTSGEAQKSGCRPEEARHLCELIAQKPHLSLRGLMTMGPLGGTEQQTRAAFATLRALGESIQDLCHEKRVELSMGMSGDFPLAIAEGATMVRIGSRIVGSREE
ncbi:YggS family pyridoxal phosphate-dependent enzyme [Chitinivibrio alkaliphilus]|uniref:Pyridoxal phosphate homeostasis protein n=1 Tax=Chitinivibrio alkaliphilus ACht1 TaxID=1313304 RepID=U7DDU8_9BACT|nr:YggS family pyridoxal phosphate-dependent enzyme [Chitinivibrio alkaliphilus]ERP39076.1 alanine racemase [Chitinivibrio alkaliphilus ACht1]